MSRSLSVVLICFCFFLFGCPEDKEPSPAVDTRIDLPTSGVSLSYPGNTEFPNEILCDTPFDAKGIKFLTRKATKQEWDFLQVCSPIVKNSNYALRLRAGSVLEIDISKYKGIKAIEIEIAHINTIATNSPVTLYNSQGKMIEEQATTNYPTRIIRFQKDLEDAKKIIIIGKAEVIDLRSFYIRPN